MKPAAKDDREIRYLGDVRRLQLKADDVVVVNLSFLLPNDVLARFVAHMESLLPLGNKVIVLWPGVEISVAGA